MRNFYIFAFIFLPFSIFAQTINDCVDAEVVCNNGNITFNPQGAGIDDFANPNNNSGCLATGEHSSAWYYFEINATAPPNQTLGFTINPNGGAGQDYDFACSNNLGRVFFQNKNPAGRSWITNSLKQNT